MNRFFTIGLMTAALSACIGPIDDGKSSSSKAPSSSAVSVQSSSIRPQVPSSSSSLILSSSSSALPVSSRSSLPVSSSSLRVSSSSAPSLSSSVPPSSSSVRSSSSAPLPPVVGDANRGKLLLLGDLGTNGKCTGCHQDSDGDGYMSGPAPGAVIDPDRLGRLSARASYSTANGATDVAQYILANMSAFGTGGCNAQCASDIAAYLWSKRDGIEGPTPAQNACDLDAGEIRYGTRALKVLTQKEYTNSLKALFNAPLPKDYSSNIGADKKQKGFPNNIDLLITSDYFDRYEVVAGQVATWALANPASLDFTCREAAACARDFTQGFAAKAFRRPLTAQEVASYTQVITSASTPAVGLEWAIRSVLSSPQFLYRSELGRTVAKALLGEPVVAPQPPATSSEVRVGEPSTLVTLNDVTYDGSGFASYGAFKYVGGTPNYTWTGNDAVEVTVSGNGRFGLSIANKEIYQDNITSKVTLRFPVTHANGTGVFVQTFNQSSGTLQVSRLKVGPAVTSGSTGGSTATPTQGIDKTKLQTADANAYVLDAYEYAAAISYFLTASSPDDELMAAAASGAIFNRVELEKQIDRLIDSPLGREQVGAFAGLWFGTDKIMIPADTPRNGNPAFTAAVRESMAHEIREIFKESFYNEGDFLDIYRGDFTMLDKTLSDYYGIPGGGSRHLEFRRVATANTNRGGIFASGAFMATYAAVDQTSPVKRSVHFRQEILCQDVPAPTSLGADMLDRTEKLEAANLIRDDGMGTEAEYYTVVTSPKACDNCHKLIINPLFAVDDFDRFGRLRERKGDDVYQTAMTYYAKKLDQNGNPSLDVNGNPIFEAKPGTAVVESVGINAGGFLFGGAEVGSIGTAAIDDEARRQGIAFKGAKQLAQLAADKNLPGLEACLIDRSARLAFGEPLDKRLVDPNAGRTKEEQLNFDCVKSDVTEAYSASGNSARAVFKALALSDALLFRK
jgi:hypothetical protein